MRRVIFRSFLFCALLSVAQGAVLTVKSSGGTYSPVTQANIQAAIDAAGCGDEVQLEAGSVTFLNAPPGGPRSGGLPAVLYINKNCAPGNAFTLTTTKKALLPDHDSRITPSHAP